MAPVPIALVDHDCGLDRALLVDMAEMLSVESQRDFAKPEPWGYGLGAVCRVAQSLSDVAPGEWVMAFWSHPDVPGALGYHDVGPNGMPALHIFPFLDDPANCGITETHELYEALADANCQTSVVGPDGVIRAREPGDPVEAQSYAYTCASGRILRATNWVRPTWFMPAPDGSVPYDFMGQLHSFGEIAPGGYAITFDTATGSWAQTVNGEKRAYRKALDATRYSRFAKRVSNRPGTDPLDSLESEITKRMR